MDGDPTARIRGCGGNFRQCHHHISTLRYRGGFDDCELARIAWCIVPSFAETIRLLGVSGFFYFLVERPGIAAEADRLLAVTGMEWSYACSRSAACLGYRGRHRIYLRIPSGNLYPSL